LVLNRYREKVDSYFDPIAKAFSRISPNTLSVISLLCAFIAMLILIIINDPAALIIALIFVILNGFFDTLDGKVAKIMGKANARGDLVDHVIDRFADFFILTGISLSSFADVRIGVIALGSVMIASYMGTQSQALGLKRDYGGILGRAERMILLMIFLLLAYIIETSVAGGSGRILVSDGLWLSVLDVMLLVFIVLANLTTVQRFRRIWRGLGGA